MMTSKILGVDGNWLLHRVHAVVTSHPNKSISNSICNRFAGSACNDALAVKAKTIVVAFDCASESNFRYGLYPDYKANRNHNRCGTDDPYTYLQDVKNYLGHLGIHVVQEKKYEADDVLCSLAAQNDLVVIATRDKDAYQYLRPGITLYDSSHKVKKVPRPKTTKHTDIKTIFGVEPSQCVEYQALAGDGIDYIPSLMSKAKAANGLTEWGTIKTWAANDATFHKLIKANIDKLRTNIKLVRLVNDIRVKTPLIQWSNDPKAPSSYFGLKDFCNPKSKGLF